jgi:predicted kinase
VGKLAILVVLSGPVCSGKTTLATSVEVGPLVLVLNTGRVLQRMLEPWPNLWDRHEAQTTRRDLQQLGAFVTASRGAGWFLGYVDELAARAYDEVIVVVDAVRTIAHVEAARAAEAHVVHIHLTAPYDVLASRYSQRPVGGFLELSSYAEVAKDHDEGQIGRLASVADLTIDTAANDVQGTRRMASVAIATSRLAAGQMPLGLLDLADAGVRTGLGSPVVSAKRRTAKKEPRRRIAQKRGNGPPNG